MTDTELHDATKDTTAPVADVVPKETAPAADAAPVNLTATLKESAGKFGAQANDQARALVDTGKEKAVGALDQLAQMLTEAAGQVDEKLGAQFGDYARSAAGQVSGFSDQVKAKDMDALLEDARTFVKKSPGAAIGIAAALGFVVARVVQSGIDADAGRTGG